MPGGHRRQDVKFTRKDFFGCLEAVFLPRKSIKEVTADWDRLESLKTLALSLAESLDDPDGTHSKAQLARQYRETLREIDELEGANGDDEIAGIINRAADGKPKAD